MIKDVSDESERSDGLGREFFFLLAVRSGAFGTVAAIAFTDRVHLHHDLRSPPAHIITPNIKPATAAIITAQA